ncbi:unnamed protein product, partial [Closterium sp. NIES-53]
LRTCSPARTSEPPAPDPTAQAHYTQATCVPFPSSFLPLSPPHPPIPPSPPQLRTCFSYTDFWPTDSRPYGSGALFTGNLRAADVADARERLEAKLAEGAGCPVAVFFLKDERREKEV